MASHPNSILHQMSWMALSMAIGLEKSKMRSNVKNLEYLLKISSQLLTCTLAISEENKFTPGSSTSMRYALLQGTSSAITKRYTKVLLIHSPQLFSKLVLGFKSSQSFLPISLSFFPPSFTFAFWSCFSISTNFKLRIYNVSAEALEVGHVRKTVQGTS